MTKLEMKVTVHFSLRTRDLGGLHASGAPSVLTGEPQVGRVGGPGQQEQEQGSGCSFFPPKKSQKSKGTVLAAAYIVEAGPSQIP